MVREKIAVPGRIEVIPIKYGYFDALRFWFPFWTRNRPIEHVYTQIRVALQRARRTHAEAQLSIIAHSFGTYVIGEILRRGFDLQVRRLVLCGCVLPEDYPWHQLQGRFDDDEVVNECGKADMWPVLAKSLSWGYGASGTHGFGSVLVKDRFHAGGHGQYFDPKFVEKYWEPFIRRGEYEKSDFEAKMPPTPWWMSVLGILPLKWIIVIVLFVLNTFFLVRSVTSFAHNPAVVEDQSTNNLALAMRKAKTQAAFSPFNNGTTSGNKIRSHVKINRMAIRQEKDAFPFVITLFFDGSWTELRPEDDDNSRSYKKCPGTYMVKAKFQENTFVCDWPTVQIEFGTVEIPPEIVKQQFTISIKKIMQFYRDPDFQ